MIIKCINNKVLGKDDFSRTDKSLLIQVRILVGSIKGQKFCNHELSLLIKLAYESLLEMREESSHFDLPGLVLVRMIMQFDRVKRGAWDQTSSPGRRGGKRRKPRISQPTAKIAN